MSTDPQTLGPFGAYTIEAGKSIAEAIDDGGAPPGGVAGDIQFNKGDGTFANAAGIAASCQAAIDGSGNMTFTSTGVMAFTSELDNVTFEANNQYTAGAEKIQLNAGGDTTIIVDGSVSPNTVTMDSDLNNTEFFIAPSAGQSLSVGNSTGFHLGFFGTTPVVKPTVTGAKAGNTALTLSLLAALAALGLITDSTT